MTTAMTAVNESLARAQKALLALAMPSSDAPGAMSFLVPSDSGVSTTAQVVIANHFVSSLTPTLIEYACATFRAAQLPDGSFGAYSFSKSGDPIATALCHAALSILVAAEGAPPDADLAACAERARAFVEETSALDAAVSALADGSPAIFFLALAGVVEPSRLPSFALWPFLFEELADLAQKRLALGPTLLLAVAGGITSHLRDEWGPHPSRASFLAAAEGKKISAFVSQFQNPTGSWFGAVPMTALAICALHAFGAPSDAPAITAAVHWFSLQKNPSIGHRATGSGCWTTSLSLRALVASGVSRRDPIVQDSLSWLLRGQATKPVVTFTSEGAPKTGGWGFQIDDPVMQDCDDTGVILGALGALLEAPSGDTLDDALSAQTRTAACRARDWLLGMQNPGGGWPSYQYGFPDKPPGPIMTTSPGLVFTSLEAFRASFESLAATLADPATEDVTGRVLFGLGQLGYTAADPSIARAIAYLQSQQCTLGQVGDASRPDERGPWWSRWATGYLAATAWILRGLAAVGADLNGPWIQGAIRWTKERQRPDGGWGEDTASYADPSLAGTSATTSMVPLTSLVLLGLMDAGEGESPEVDRGIAHLLDREHAGPDGGKNGQWAGDPWLSPLLPPHMFYFIETSPYYVLEALARHVAVRSGRGLAVARGGVTLESLERAKRGAGESPSPALLSHDERGAWSDAFLDAMRERGDEGADAVIREIFAEGAASAVSDVLARLVRSDDPIPEGLPPKAQAYFERTAELPGWYDPAKVAAGEALFARCGWTAALSLFCSSLPQAYAAAKGARALAGTADMTRQVERRVFETAQFLFDVMDKGGLSDKGRGVRAIQKVRLMHGAIRHLTLRQASWDMGCGVPINQEDLAGTLLSFSCVLLAAWNRIGLRVTAEEAESYLHCWKVVGHVLGIQEELLPRDVADGDALMDAIRRRQWAPSPEGQRLAQALLSLMERYLPTQGLSSLPVTVMRELAGDRCCDLLGLPPAGWTDVLFRAGSAIDSALSHVGRTDSGVAGALNKAAYDLLQGLVLAERTGKQARFRIPSSLLQDSNTPGR